MLMVVLRRYCYSVPLVALALLAPLRAAASGGDLSSQQAKDVSLDLDTFHDLLQVVTPSHDDEKFRTDLGILTDHSAEARTLISTFVKEISGDRVLSFNRPEAYHESIALFRQRLKRIIVQNRDLLQRLDVMRATMTDLDKRSGTGEHVKSPEQRHRAWQTLLGLFNELKGLSFSLQSNETRAQLGAFLTEASPLIEQEPKEFWPFAIPFLRYQEHLKVVHGALTPNVASRENGTDAKAHRVTGAERLNIIKRKFNSVYAKQNHRTKTQGQAETLPAEWQHLFGEMKALLGEIPPVDDQKETDARSAEGSAAPQSGRTKIIEQVRQLVSEFSPARARPVIREALPPPGRMLDRYVKIFDDYWGHHSHDTSGSTVYQKLGPLLWHTMRLNENHRSLAMQALDKTFFPPMASGHSPPAPIKQTHKNPAIGANIKRH